MQAGTRHPRCGPHPLPSDAGERVETEWWGPGSLRAPTLCEVDGLRTDLEDREGRARALGALDRGKCEARALNVCRQGYTDHLE
jgi:hypothetical protein